MARIYVMRDENVTVISRRRPRLPGVRPTLLRPNRKSPRSAPQRPGADEAGLRPSRHPDKSVNRPEAGSLSLGSGAARGGPDGQRLRRSWRGLVEFPVRSHRAHGETALIFLSPVAIGALGAAVAPIEVGVAAGGLALVASTYLTPLLRRRLADRLADRRLNRPGNLILTGTRERTAWDRAVATADRISETWPALASLIDVAEAEVLLTEALWEIAGVLAHRQELDRVLADLSHPDFADAADETASEVHYQLSVARSAQAEINAAFVRREASLRRAEKAGRDFIREQEMRRAIQSAEHSLRATPLLGLPSAPLVPDAGADLAEQTRSVLDAYRELTAVLRPT